MTNLTTKQKTPNEEMLELSDRLAKNHAKLSHSLTETVLMCFDCLPPKPMKDHLYLHGIKVHQRIDYPPDAIYFINEDNMTPKEPTVDKWERDLIKEITEWYREQHGSCMCMGDCERCGHHICFGCGCFILDKIQERIDISVQEAKAERDEYWKIKLMRSKISNKIFDDLLASLKQEESK